MEGIDGGCLHEGPKHIYALPGTNIYTGTSGDEMRSKDSSARHKWRNKATGADELPIDLTTAAGEAAITGLTALCQ